MAIPPSPDNELIAAFGPHLAYTPPGGWNASSDGAPPRLVKTHCCFCGQQCGIQLKVSDDRVVGFEPWEEFPFNRGMLCPKGVRRYLQANHRDRLMSPLRRTAHGFEPASWDDALGRTVAAVHKIQGAHGKDAVAVLGGASLTSEKSYLVGKLARVALGTRHVDYNGGRLMSDATPPERQRALTALDTVIAFLVVILVAQMWILGATLESYLGGHTDDAIVGAIVSGVLFLGAGGLYLVIRRIDARQQRS